ncbi:ATP-grasp domain-containing protein [Lacticaseibacillus pabuli]|uniref:ATP-grasp domain-containing protein n=1 Tax=Lacticaseibacillus pabuli TaxID=3025672 RepID=A0ABY7WWX3_9LACO|nr:ATP-grasp domain-containing protein [Lacticaseibacillus sp. KACC 23028]WDF83452.1 ATP-grasp domain-containing protein [Lacticaseibacillus sp. KACC 23028]
MTKFIAPGSFVGIIGGGFAGYQLAMTARQMGMKTVILTSSVDDIAFKAADMKMVGSANDPKVLSEFKKHVDVMTYIDETVVGGEMLADAVPAAQLPSGTDILSFTQDRYLEKIFLEDLKMNVLPYTQVVSSDDVDKAIDSLGYPSVLKPLQKSLNDRHLLLETDADVWRAKGLMDSRPFIMESWLDHPRQLAIICVKSDDGLQVMPLIEIDEGIEGLNAAIEPAQVDGSVLVESLRVAETVGAKVDYLGVFAIEFFLTKEGTLYVKRVTPGPRMYGDVIGSVAPDDQYDLHLRAVLGWPVPTVPIDGSAILIPLRESQRDAVATQIQIKPKWRWRFFAAGPVFGELTVPGPLMDALSAISATQQFEINAQPQTYKSEDK